MTDAFATHEVFNQSPPFEDVNLFTTDPALMEAVDREGGGPRRQAAGGVRAQSAAAPKLSSTAGSPTSIRRASSPSTPRAAGSTWSSSIRPTTRCMEHERHRRPALLGVGSSGEARRGKPVAGANVARSAGSYMAIADGGRAPVPDHHDQRRGADPAAAARDLASGWVPKILARDYDQSFKPAGGEARRHHRHGHDGEAGRHRRARQHDDGRAGRRRRARRRVPHHRPQMVHVGADVRRLPGAGAGAGRALLLPDAALPARRQRQRAALPAPQGQARQPLQCLLRGRVPRRARLADRRGGPRRPDHHRDGDAARGSIAPSPRPA